MRERSPFRLLVVLLGVLALLGFTACGDDDDDEAATTTTEAAAAAEPDDPAAAEAEIRANIETLFTSLGAAGAAEDGAAKEAARDQVVANIENGDDYRDTIVTVEPLAAGLAVVIDSVTFTSDTTADFQYDLLIGGNPTQVTDSTGTAVQQDGTWKLSADVWESLVALAEAATGGGGGGGEEEPAEG